MMNAHAEISRFALRRRQKAARSILGSVKILLFGVLVVACTAGPTALFDWDTLVPACIGIAIFVVALFTVLLMFPLSLIAYVDICFERRMDGLPFPGLRWGHALYRRSGSLDTVAREAGLPALSDFECPDVLDTGQPPSWYQPETALPTVELLLAHVKSDLPLHRDLKYLHTALSLANEKGVRFYLLLKTWDGVTNAEIEEARRSGSLTGKPE